MDGKWGAGARLGCLGPRIRFVEDGYSGIADLSTLRGSIRQLCENIQQRMAQGKSTTAEMQELAGTLAFTQSAVRWRFGGFFFSPVFRPYSQKQRKLLAKSGGQLTLESSSHT